MKSLLMAFLMVLLLVGQAWADSNVTFAWDANTETDLAGYRLYQSSTPGTYTFGESEAVVTIPAGTETVQITVPDGTLYFVLTAYDTDGNESGPSNEVTPGDLDTTPPVNPSGVRITVVVKVEL